MAAFTAQDVKALRDATGAGMMDAKKALVEADGDRQKAAQILRQKGLKQREVTNLDDVVDHDDGGQYRVAANGWHAPGG